ncbi:MAG: transposase [Desulfobulbus sp.]|nr:transposase [Desulfobulbus sp.]
MPGYKGVTSQRTGPRTSGKEGCGCALDQENRPLTSREQEGNRTRSRIRSRIEHVFGVQTQRAGNLLLRTIGIARARAKIGLRNLAYNIDRMGMLLTAGG